MTSQNYVKSYHLTTSKTLKKLCETKQFCLKEKFWQITSLLKILHQLQIYRSIFWIKLKRTLKYRSVFTGFHVVIVTPICLFIIIFYEPNELGLRLIFQLIKMSWAGKFNLSSWAEPSWMGRFNLASWAELFQKLNLASWAEPKSSARLSASYEPSYSSFHL